MPVVHPGRGDRQERPYTRPVIELPPSLLASIAQRGRGLTVLVVRLGALGDIVRTLPAVRLVRRALPDARFHWVAWEPWAGILAGHPDLDRVLPLPRAVWRRQTRAPGSWGALAGSLRRFVADLRTPEPPGLVLDFHGDLRSGLTGRLSGAPIRLGYSGHQQKEGNRLFTTHRVPSGDRRASRISRNLDLVRALGLPDGPMPGAGIALTVEERERAEQITGAGTPYAVLNPGASPRQSYKKPPPGLLATAARAAASSGVKPLLVHGPGEEADAAAVVRAAGGGLSVAPPTSLKVLAALLQGARLFVGGDSGPLHLACGVGCPVVGLYGPTDPQVNAPWGVPFAVVAPAGRAYTGIKAIDRASGGFEGLDEATVENAVRSVLAVQRSS
jgi:lipopolysaccharide heptosyltransferase I